MSGPTCSGKSAVIESVVEALRLSSESSESLDSSYKLQKFYPLASNDLSTIFGSMNSSQQWVDGLFTAAWKKAARVQNQLSLPSPHDILIISLERNVLIF